MGIPLAASGMTIRQLRKSYAMHEVLKGVDLTLHRGEVHALLGPNGAGKSTLLGCLSGAVTPDSGEILIGERSYQSFTPKLAFEAGTAIIYQHFQLIGSLSVSDNIFLGNELRTAWGATRFAAQALRSAEILESLGVDIDPSRLVETLSVGEQQVVEIARAVLKEPSVLILDEPTAALSEHEVSALLDMVRRLARDHGLTVIYVTHLLREVLEVADAVTVIRDGGVLWTKRIEELGLVDLVHAISPESIDRQPSSSRTLGNDLLILDNYQGPWTGPVDLRLRAGEIVGVFGLLGAGRTDFLESLAGVRRANAGAELRGRQLSSATPLEARRQGVAFVASDRKEQSLFSEMTAQENLLIPHYRALSKPWRSMRQERGVFKVTARQVGLVPADPEKDAGTLSGGNAQKLMLGRWMTGVDETCLLLLDEPTQGVDIGARHDLYELIRGYAALPNHGVIFSSSDPEEIVALADRVIVLVDGHVAGVVDPGIGEENLLTLAHG